MSKFRTLLKIPDDIIRETLLYFWEESCLEKNNE